MPCVSNFKSHYFQCDFLELKICFFSSTSYSKMFKDFQNNLCLFPDQLVTPGHVTEPHLTGKNDMECKECLAPNVMMISLFPTCQVRVVRFYVSLLFSFSSSSSPPSSSSSINWDPLSSVWRAGPQWQLGSSEFSVACRTTTAIR